MMQSKTIFIVLFMLSFTVMHDTVINMLNSNETLPVSSYVESQDKTNEHTDIHDIHSMFHFMALLTDTYATLKPLETEDVFSHYVFQYLSPYLKNNIKPPIV